MITNATATDTNNRNHQVKWIPTSQSALSWAVKTKLEHKVCKKRPETILFPLFFWTPSLIIHVFCQRCVKHFCQTFNIWKWEHLLDRTASGQISETMHSKLCPFSICTQVAKEVYIHCIVWLYIGKIDENKVFARQYCQETCYRSWVAIATWAAR